MIKNWEGIHRGCILSPCLFNIYTEYITWYVGLDELQAGIKIARRNINHLKYAYGTTLMAEIEEKLKNLLMKVKEESKNSWLKTQHYKKKKKKANIMASGRWQIEG